MDRVQLPGSFPLAEGLVKSPKPLMKKQAVKRHHHKHNLRHRYEFLETLGKGTYGKVKKARDRSGKLVRRTDGAKDGMLMMMMMMPHAGSQPAVGSGCVRRRAETHSPCSIFPRLLAGYLFSGLRVRPGLLLPKPVSRYVIVHL